MGLSQRRKPLRGCVSSHMRAHAFRFCKRAWVSDKRSEAKKQKCGTRGMGCRQVRQSRVLFCTAMWLDVALAGICFCLGQRKVSAQEMCEAHGAEGRYVCVSSDGGRQCSKRKRRNRQSTGQAGSCRFQRGSVSSGRATIQPAVKTARILWLVVAPFPYCTLFHRLPSDEPVRKSCLRSFT